MKTINDVLEWLQQAENEGFTSCGTQNIKRHLESVIKHQHLKNHNGMDETNIIHHCGNKLNEKEEFYGFCLKCSENI